MAIRPIPYIVSVNRDTHRLIIRKRRATYPRRFVIAETFEVAVGRRGFRTPQGFYEVTKKELNPTWTPPDEDWVGPDLRDENGKPKTLASDDPNNPLAGAFLWVNEKEAIGIHGTKNLDSLGQDASHGCIRVDPDVAVYLYKILPIYTPVLIN